MNQDTKSPRYAHPFRRVIAYVVDGVVVAALIFLALTLVTLLLGPTVRFDDSSTSGLTVDRGRAVGNAVVGVLVGGLYFVGSWIRTGRTVGAVLFDLHVASANGGRRLSVGEAVVRWIAIGAPLALSSPIVRRSPVMVATLTLATVAWAVLLLSTTIVDARHRGLHDRLARSVVLRGRAPEPREAVDSTN
jgi:uncharacterized RDD family membrane protein YckC